MKTIPRKIHEYFYQSITKTNAKFEGMCEEKCTPYLLLPTKLSLILYAQNGNEVLFCKPAVTLTEAGATRMEVINDNYGAINSHTNI
jgi:hypothetical protein